MRQMHRLSRREMKIQSLQKDARWERLRRNLRVLSQMIVCDIVRRKKTGKGKHPPAGTEGRSKCYDPKGSISSDGGLAGDIGDIAAADAEVAQFTVRHAAEFVDGPTILAPVVERACQVHVFTPFLGFLLGGRSSLAPPRSVDLEYKPRRRKEQRWNSTAPMHFVHVKRKF